MATMSPLRQLIEDMTVCNLSPATQQSYVYAVARFSRHFGVPPARLGPEECARLPTGPGHDGWASAQGLAVRRLGRIARELGIRLRGRGAAASCVELNALRCSFPSSPRAPVGSLPQPAIPVGNYLTCRRTVANASIGAAAPAPVRTSRTPRRD